MLPGGQSGGIGHRLRFALILINHNTDTRLWAVCEAVIWSRIGPLESMAKVKAGMREARLKAALRENLKRRKAQARLREETVPDSETVADERPDTPRRPGE
jgi:hypothetical protein